MFQLVTTYAGLTHIQYGLIRTCEEVFKPNNVFTYKKLYDGGTQVRENMITMRSPYLNHLERVVRSNIFTLYPNQEIDELKVFANFNPAFEKENAFHDHPKYDVAAVYYPVNTMGFGGELEFLNPHIIIDIDDDLLVIFPSSYSHRVRPYSGNGRYSIAFDCSFKR